MTASSYLPPDYTPLAPYGVHVVLADGSEESYRFEALWMAANFSLVARAHHVQRVHVFDGRARTVMVWRAGLFDAVNAYFGALTDNQGVTDAIRERTQHLEMLVREYRVLVDMGNGAT